MSPALLAALAAAASAAAEWSEASSEWSEAPPPAEAAEAETEAAVAETEAETAERRAQRREIEHQQRLQWQKLLDLDQLVTDGSNENVVPAPAGATAGPPAPAPPVFTAAGAVSVRIASVTQIFHSNRAGPSSLCKLGMRIPLPCPVPVLCPP